MDTIFSRGQILIVDGSNLMARAWFTTADRSLPSFTEKVRQMLSGAVRRWRPTHLVVALDSPNGFRLEAIPGYKADRKGRSGPSTAELTQALRPALESWNVAIREADGLEADDVIAALVRKAVEIDCPASILSKDSDLLQLVNDGANVRVLWPEGKREGESVFDYQSVRTYLAVHKDFQAPIGPEHLLDLRTMAGGKDGLPRIEIRGEGIKAPYGFTTRRAAQLLSEGATLDSLLGGDSHLLSDRERGWMEACRDSALERRANLRLRAEVDPEGSGATSVAQQRLSEPYRGAPQPESVTAPEPRARVQSIQVQCAGGCGRMQTCEPYHDPAGVYCMACGILSSREDARRRRAARKELAHV